MKQPSEESPSWENYGNSSLPMLLRYDNWSCLIGLSVLSGIDPKKSELFRASSYYKVPYDELGMFQAETGTDLAEYDYWKVQLLSDPPNRARRTWYISLEEYEDACAEWDRTNQFLGMKSLPLDVLDKRHQEATMYFAELKELFFSNPDHDYSFTAPPIYFIEWARIRRLEIPWLEWASARQLVDVPSQDVVQVAPPDRNDEWDADLPIRAETTYLNIIGGMLGLMFGQTTQGKKNSVFRNQTDVINALLNEYPNTPGIRQRTLEEKFAKAKGSLIQ